MPLIQLKLMEQVFTLTQKKEIVSKLMDTVVPFEGEKCAPSPGSASKRFAALYGASAGRPGPQERCPPLPKAKSKTKHTGGRYEHH